MIGSFPQLEPADRFRPPQASSARSASRLTKGLLSLVATLLLTICVAARPATAQPVFVGASSAMGPSYAVPAGNVGDLLVFVVGVEVNPATTTPSGFTAVAGHDGFNGAVCGSDGDPLGSTASLRFFGRLPMAPKAPRSALASAQAVNRPAASCATQALIRPTRSAL